jgi:hypothetical protein
MRIPAWRDRTALVVLGVLALCAPAAAASPSAGSKHVGGAAATGGAASDTALTFPAFSEALAALAPDSERVAEIASVQIVRAAGVFVFEHGTLALCQPVAGVTRAAVFSGRGTFLMSPPAGPERDQVEREFGRPALRRDFQTLVLLFSDSTLTELSQIASFHGGALPKVMRETLRDLLPYVVGTDSHAPPPRVAKPLLDPVGGGLFLAAMASADGPLVFAIDPQQIESVELLRRPDNDRQGILVRHALEIVTRFRADGDTLDLPASGDTRPPVRVRHAALDVSTGAELALRVTAVLDLEAAADRQRWLPFQVPPGTVVENVSWEGGARAPHWNWANNPVLWVRCDPPLQAGERRTLRVGYRTHTVIPVSDVVTNHVIDNAAAQGWYPRLGREDSTTFELAFHVPSHLQLAASGANVGEFTRGGITTSRWSLDRPAPFASFEIGPFRRFDIQPDSLPRLSVYLVDVHHAGRSEDLSLLPGAARSTEQQHALEVAGEVQFLRRTFGPIPNLTLRAVEGTDEDVASTPQLVRLPSMFSSTSEAAVPPAFFRARELARQWWGIETRPASSRDAWLAEGLANFSAVWCVQSGAPGSGVYFGLLESWRRQLIEQRDALPDRNTLPSPLHLGARLDEIPGSGMRPEGADGAHLALQSAWVIHMLRGLLLDPDDPDERRFAGLMSSFYAAHRGGVMNTEQFRSAAEQVAGRDLGWFFDQWVDHAAIPTYTFSYRVDQASDGRYVVHGRVKQSHVPPSFRMDVPVRIELASGAPERLRVQVSGPVTEFDLPPVSGKPARVVFNDLGAVLCEVIEAPWE